MAMGRQVTTQATAVRLDALAGTASPNYVALAGLDGAGYGRSASLRPLVRPGFIAAHSIGLTRQHDISHRLHPVAGERTVRAAVPSFETWHQTRPPKSAAWVVRYASSLLYVCQVEKRATRQHQPRHVRGDMITGSLAVAEATEPPPRWEALGAS